jgi:hypothetical protein
LSKWEALAAWVAVRPRLGEDSVRNIISPANKYNSEEVFAKIANYRLLLEQFADRPEIRSSSFGMSKDSA